MLLVCGCVTTHDPQPSDTKFDPAKRNWVEIYQNEIKIAIDNGDAGAYHFFMQELIKERNRFLIEEIQRWNKTEKKEVHPRRLK